MSQNRTGHSGSRPIPPKAKAKAKAKAKGRPVPPQARVKPATAADWIAGARLRTLPLAIAPVFIGTGASVVALGAARLHWVQGLACLAVALFLQIGVNYANDYSDGIRGTDAYRVGPSRLTGSGRAKARTVLTVALVFFALAAIAGLAVIIRTQHWWLLLVGVAAIAAAWFYTGGKRPYGYFGLGELFVFVFFGLVATAGTTYMLAGRVNTEGWLGGVAAGLIACAVLIANNLRDIEPDRKSGKRTLTVLIGSTASRVLYCLILLFAYLIVAFFALFYPFAWLAMFSLLAAIPAAIIVCTAKTSRELILALQLTSIAGLAVGVFLGIAFGVIF